MHKTDQQLLQGELQATQSPGVLPQSIKQLLTLEQKQKTPSQRLPS